MTITDSVVRDNSADENGGGIHHHGTLTLDDVVVKGNAARWYGGVIVNHGNVRLGGGSSVVSNTVRTRGGGIWNDADPINGIGTVTCSMVSIAGNTPDDCFGTTACPAVPPVYEQARVEGRAAGDDGEPPLPRGRRRCPRP